MGIFTMSVFESYWANKAACDDAERAYYEKLSGCKPVEAEAPGAKKEGASAVDAKTDPGAFKNAANGERTFIMCKPAAKPAPAKPAPAEPAPAKPAPADEEDDDVDLFGSSDEEESEEKKRITEERLKAYHEKKAKKPQVIAKTSVLLDVKPWDDETDHDQMLASVKSIEMDGLLWGAHKLIPIGYGIKKLQVMCTVEDEKVSVEELTEKIEEFEDFVQSCDVNAMNKI